MIVDFSGRSPASDPIEDCHRLGVEERLDIVLGLIEEHPADPQLLHERQRLLIRLALLRGQAELRVVLTLLGPGWRRN